MLNKKNDNTVILGHDILPIMSVQQVQIRAQGTDIKLIDFHGTGFVIAKNLFVTCWHCVNSPLQDNDLYVVVIGSPAGNNEVLPLNNIEKDRNGHDLATANLEHEPTCELALASENALCGTDVYTFGYPHHEKERLQSGGLRFKFRGRYLRGYVTRIFNYEDKTFGQMPSYELDMPAPSGLSGAPIVKVGSRQVLGVVYGNNDVDSIEELASIDSETGERQPEIVRRVSFGLAHNTDTLRNLRGAATQDVPLAEYISQVKE